MASHGPEEKAVEQQERKCLSKIPGRELHGEPSPFQLLHNRIQNEDLWRIVDINPDVHTLS